jgi:hypothetical protein
MAIVEIIHHFFDEESQLSGHTTATNVYLHLKGENIDLEHFEVHAIKYVGLSLTLEKRDRYISVYRAAAKEFGIKIEKDEKVEKDVEKDVVKVEGVDAVDVVGHKLHQSEPEVATPTVEAKAEEVEEIDVKLADDAKDVVQIEVVDDVQQAAKDAEEFERKAREEAAKVPKPRRRAAARSKTKGLVVGKKK